MISKLEAYFEFARLGATWRMEVLAGFTTFVTMAYIVFVNPSILAETGMPFAAVMAATCLSAAFASILMGALARYPIALAPGMGLNAYFTYAVVKGMGAPWRTALGAVFVSGVVFFLLTAIGARRMIVAAIPAELHGSVAAGIGLFIAFIGLKNAGVVVANPATLVGMGDLHKPETALALFGLVLTGALLARGVRGAILIGILATATAAAGFGLAHWQPREMPLAAIGATAFQLDLAGLARLRLLDIVFAFLFVDLFDNIGTLVAVGKKARLFNDANEIPRVNRILFADSLATIFGSLMGTSTVVSYIESAAGVVAGGRTGVTAIVTGVLFLAAMFVAPLVGAIPMAATAPALILAGAMMMEHAAETDWKNPLIAIPSFLTMIAIPLTFSIASGLALGFTAYTLLHVLAGKWRNVSGPMYGLTALFIARLAWFGAQ